ncbi:MAG: hypothetical protein U0793_28620 [Gemmataceae bacterium]
MIQFNCRSCKYQYRVDNALAGAGGTCAWCGKPLVIPQPYSEGTVTDDERDIRQVEGLSKPQPGPDRRQEVYDPASRTYHDPAPGLPGWVIWVGIILLLNIIILPLTGYVIVPR